MRKSKVIEDDMCEEEIDPEEMEEEAFLKILPGLPPRFTYHELMEATDNFSRILGTGGFGSVYEGVLRDTNKVAVKKLDGPRQGYKEFRAEVATIGSISHLNLNCRGSQSSKSKKENRSRSDDNGAVTDIVLSKDNVDQPMYRLREPKDYLGLLKRNQTFDILGYKMYIDGFDKN